MSKRLNSAALPSLKLALTRVFWYKKELRSFLSACLQDEGIISQLDWEDYKRNIVERLIDTMVANQQRHLNQLIDLMLSLSELDDPHWLRQIEDGETKYKEAVAAIRSLRIQTEPYRRARTQQEEAERRARETSSRAAARRAIERELEDLKGLLLDFTTQPVQERGYSLERLLNQLFQVFDITSRPSFRTVGEQIDGAFTLNQHDFLVEAKWTTDKVGLADLDAFSGKVGRKLDNTLGLLISMNGFQDTAVSSYSQKRSTIILMDGADLYAVLDGRIELQELIQRKRRHAAQTGNVLFPVSNMLAA